MVSHRHKDGQKKHEKIPVVISLDIVERIERKRICLVGEKRHYDREIIAIRLNKVVTRDRCWIDVVFTEISQEVLYLKMNRIISSRIGFSSQFLL